MDFYRIKDLREDSDKKQTEVAEIIEVSEAQYRRYEQGKNTLPFDKAVLLSNYYNVSLDYLAGLTNDKGGLHCNFLDSEEKKLLQGFAELKQDDKNFILQMIDKLSDKPQTNAGRKSVG